MRPAPRMLWVILFGIPALLVLPIAFVGSQVWEPGTIDVRVVEKHPGGCNVGATVPAMMVPVAMHLIPAECHMQIDADLDEDTRMALDMARAVISQLGRCPDGIYVDVQSDRDIVTIEKRDGKFHIFVDTPDERIDLSVPVHTVSSVLSAI